MVQFGVSTALVKQKQDPYTQRIVQSLSRISSERYLQVVGTLLCKGSVLLMVLLCLRDISADPTGNQAVATIENVFGFGENEPFYELHPCTLDKLVQLMTVAQHEGKLSLFTQLSMPTYIDEIYISGGMKELRATASSYKDFMDAWSGDEIATVDGKVVFEMKGLRVTSVGNSTDNEEKPKHAIQLMWKPDINFLDVKDLIPPTLDLRQYLIALERYFFLLATDTVKTIASVDTQESHLVKFRYWLNGFVETASRGENQFLPDGKELATLSNQNRLSLINSMTNEFEASPLSCVATAIRRIHESAKGRWEGSVDTLELLMEGGVLTQVCLYGIVNGDINADILDLCLFRLELGLFCFPAKLWTLQADVEST